MTNDELLAALALLVKVVDAGVPVTTDEDDDIVCACCGYGSGDTKRRQVSRLYRKDTHEPNCPYVEALTLIERIKGEA